MKVYPDFSVFKQGYEQNPQIVWTTLVADMETPVSAMLKLANDKSNCFLLESVEGGVTRGRYSFIGINPDLIWRCFGNRAEVNRRALFDDGVFEPCEESTIASLRALCAQSHINIPEDLPPMAAGLVGYMSYDTVRLVENLADNNPDVLQTPDGIFLRPTVIAAFDNVNDTLSIITPVWQDDNISAEDAYEKANARLSEVIKALDNPVRQQKPSTTTADVKVTSNMSRDDFRQMVNKAKEYILAGDILQVVLSQRFQMPFGQPAFSLYRALRRLNPSPFLFFLDFADFAIVGSSPEILVRVRDDKVTIRPIAGTRPRGSDNNKDKELAAELLADPKELAEHLMLLDLGRNDVGRVARIGSVKVSKQMAIERYSHVMHMVSNVEGELSDDFDAIDAMLAGFPAGTVSGAPKVRAMQIIDELEPQRRGIYAGCIGYFSANGEMDTCIALRTAVVKDNTVYVQAGGGIVADSDPESEYQESCNKAQAIIKAAEEAAKFN